MRPAIDLAVAAKGRIEPGEFLDSLAGARSAGFGSVHVYIAHDLPWRGPVMHESATITLCSMPAGTSLPRLWAEAVGRGRAPHVAVLDISCPPGSQWWASLARELDRGRRTIFGAVEPGWSGADSRLTGYLAEYAQFGEPLPGWLAEVPGNNIVLPRELLPAPDTLRRNGFSKTHLVWQLEREHSVRFQTVRDFCVVYRKGYPHRSYVSRRYRHGRCFAGTRHRHPGQPPRWFCLLATPALPALRLVRIVRACWRRTDLRHALLRHLGPVIASEVAWSVGEFAGYAFGSGDSCEHLD